MGFLGCCHVGGLVVFRKGFIDAFFIEFKDLEEGVDVGGLAG
jgi:hypothetical protein